MNELNSPQEHAPITRGPGGKWLPGRSPNPAGKPKGKTLASELRRTLTAAKRRALVEKLVSMALDGDPTAQRLVWDRHDGPTRTAIDLALADQSPVPGETPELFFERVQALLIARTEALFPGWKYEPPKMTIKIVEVEESIGN